MPGTRGSNISEGLSHNQQHSSLSSEALLSLSKERLVDLLAERPVHERELFGMKISTKALQSLSPDEIRDLQFVFQTADMHYRSFLDHVELRHAMRALGFKFTIAQAEQAVRAIGMHCKNMVDFNEFLSIVIAHQGDSSDHYEEICSVFQLIATEDDDTISLNDLQKASKASGLSLTKQDLESMLKDADINQDGVIDKEEFIQIMLKTNLFKQN